MRTFVATAAALALVLSIGPAAGQALPDAENGRFSFNAVTDGMLRLDTRTGAVSICRRKEAGWACESVADDRAALESEIARLRSENGALKRELVTRGLPLPGASQNEAAKPREPSLRLPSDADVDRMMTFLEKVWRRLVDMVQRTQKEIEGKI